MDIRSFFKKPKLAPSPCESSQPVATEQQSVEPSASSASEVSCTAGTSNSVSASSTSIQKEFDIGRYVGSFSDGILENNVEVFQNIWVPEEGFDFRKVGEKRSFRHEWLKTYAPWLAYSEVGDGGAFCKFCVLFKQKVNRGLQGSFILKGFKKNIMILMSRHGSTSNLNGIKMLFQMGPI